MSAQAFRGRGQLKIERAASVKQQKKE